MSKEGTSSGLLSRVVKFVRNPATSWTNLDNNAADRDDAESKQLLKDMIERKRRNDFVRKREFDMLRKIRQREVAGGQDQATRPSFFQSSLPSKLDDRANTLRKIDEIEAQMSMQWWKTKPGGGSTELLVTTTLPSRKALPPSVPSSENEPFLANALPAGYAPTEFGDVENAIDGAVKITEGFPLLKDRALSMSAPDLPVSAKPLMATRASSVLASNQSMVPNTQLKVVREDALLRGEGSHDNAFASFDVLNSMAIEVSEIAHDAELEEASICFANGDDAAAEAGLLEMLAPHGLRIGHVETWMALFDFYRATDQQQKFETCALQFVERFERSAPQWFSIPEMARQLVTPVGQTYSNGPAADWICPSVMGIQSVAALKAALAKAPMPWRIDWSNLKSIDAGTVASVCNVFNGWAAQPVQLRFAGDAQLQQVLQTATPLNQRETDQAWWQLRMAALRVTHRADEFELVALDFCVTYEVSPKAWERACCDYKHLDLDREGVASQAFVGDVHRESVYSELSLIDEDTRMEGLSSQMSSLLSVELAGQIQGDAVEVLNKLENKLMGADIMIICCAKLVRVDFSAAGTLLNWVSARQAENRSVQFSDVNRLVAAFFKVIGISEHAKIFTRVD